MCGSSGEGVFQSDLNHRALAESEAGPEHEENILGRVNGPGQSPEVGRCVACGRKRQPVWLERENEGGGDRGAEEEGLWAEVSSLGLTSRLRAAT